ncbi:MAG: hypothetical protein WKH97_02370 [Casimicrobiaceae bacterium]
MILPVPTTLEGAIAKLMQVLSYLEEEDTRRSQWEEGVTERIEDFEDRISDIELRVINLETDSD